MATQDTDNKKKEFLEALIECFDNISEACQMVGIERRTYYNWIEKDKDFESKVYVAQKKGRSAKVDFLKTAFKRRVSEGSDACIIFGLKTLGREHGYTEHQEVAITELPKIEVVYKKPIE